MTTDIFNADFCVNTAIGRKIRASYTLQDMMEMAESGRIADYMDWVENQGHKYGEEKWS
mgnify:CR=1 FL=1